MRIHHLRHAGVIRSLDRIQTLPVRLTGLEGLKCRAHYVGIHVALGDVEACFHKELGVGGLFSS